MDCDGEERREWGIHVLHLRKSAASWRFWRMRLQMTLGWRCGGLDALLWYFWYCLLVGGRAGVRLVAGTGVRIRRHLTSSLAEPCTFHALPANFTSGKKHAAAPYPRICFLPYYLVTTSSR